MTITELAELTQMSPTTVSAIERGSLDSAIGRVYALATAVGAPLHRSP